ncbi:MAG: CreA family protein [Aeromonas sp.]
MFPVPLREQLASNKKPGWQHGAPHCRWRPRNADAVGKISTSQAFKGLQVVRFYGRKLNCLVYLTRSTRWVNCSYKNAASAVSIMPWGE